jgi:hypothetical protein
MVLRRLVQVLHPPQKSEHPPFWNSCYYGIKNYGVEVTFNDINFLLSSIKIYQMVQKLIGRTDIQTDTGRMVISLAYIFPLGKKVG